MGKPQSSIQYRRMVAVPLITHNYEITVHLIYIVTAILVK